MKPWAFGIATCLSTMTGGLFALRYRSKLPLLMGFAAGVLLGVVSFDIFPELMSQAKIGQVEPLRVMTAFVAGFLTLHVFEKLLVIHHGQEEHYVPHSHPQIGVLSALALAGHSFMDGVGIGVGFRISATAGLGIAMAVIAHDFTDGMNTVTMMLTHGNAPRSSVPYLVVDALTPILGILAAQLITFSNGFLAGYMGFFAGFLMYIGASDILPEAHSQRSSVSIIAMTILGVLSSYWVSRLL